MIKGILDFCLRERLVIFIALRGGCGLWLVFHAAGADRRHSQRG